MFGILVGIFSFAVIVLYFRGVFGSSGDHEAGSCHGRGCSGCTQNDACLKQQRNAAQKTGFYRIDAASPKILLAVVFAVSLLAGCSDPPPPVVVAEPAPSFVAQLSDDDFLTKTRKGVVLLDAYSLSCLPCRAMEPHLEKAAEKLQGKVFVARINAEANREFMRYFGIEAFPTLFLFVDGELKRKVIGYRNEEQLLELVNEFIRESPPVADGAELPSSDAGS